MVKVFHGTIPPEDEVVYVLPGYVGSSMPVSQSASRSADNGATAPTPTLPEPRPQKAPPTPTTETSDASQDEQGKEAQDEEVEEEELPEALYEKGEEASAAEQGQATFFWGEGEEGLQGRIPLRIVPPEYLSEREAKIRFEMLVDASGKVKQVRALTPGAPAALRTAGIQAIQQWKFNPLPGGPDQRIVVTMVFRLR
ncbi:MAG: TonB family protein [Bacteroidia bacterium]